MDEIIYLEPDEEITSVIDKIRASKGHSLGLVVTRDATLLQSVVNLRLLVKETTNFGKVIALITSDKIGRNLAAKVGLTVYDSVRNPQPVYEPQPLTPTNEEVIEIDESQKMSAKDIKPKGVSVHHFQEPDKSWSRKQVQPSPAPIRQNVVSKTTKPHKEVDWRKFRQVIWLLSAICLILILIGAFLVLPKASAKIKVKAENFQRETSAQISGEEGSTNLDNKIFAGTLIDLVKEKEENFSATGKKNLGGNASGTITLYNNFDSSPHNFAAGAKLSSSSKTFLFKSAVTVPGASVQNLKIVPGQANADIEAEAPGEDYNVGAGRFTIVGLGAAQQEAIYGQSSKALTGGFSKEVQVVSQSDYDQAKTKITNELTDELKKKATDQAGILEAIDNVLEINTVEEISSAKVDAEAQDFTLKIKMRLREIVFSKNQFDQFIIALLEKDIPSDKMLTLGPNDVISPQIEEKKYDQSRLILRVTATTKISTRMNVEKIKENLLGKSDREVRDYLRNIEGAAGSEISYRPNWWPVRRFPNFGNNVKVELEYLQDESSNPSPSSSPTPAISSSPSSEVAQ